jgi:hypothetical protein
VVGRASSATVRLVERYVSNQHALIRSKGDHWELRDRSHNGTYVNGVRLAHDEPHRLRSGDVIAFGDLTQEWSLVDDAAPCVMVIATAGEALTIEDTVLGIPLEGVPEVTIFRDADGSWKLESTTTGVATLLENGNEFAAGGKTWRFSCPELEASTMTNELAPREATPLLHFLVSRDEDYVELRLEY